MTKSALYCFSSIPQAAASVYFYDFNKNKNDGLKYKVEEIIKILKDSSFKPLQTNSYDISSFADGAYPFYVKINNSKKVDTIYFELRNSCGWGSSMFFERPERLIEEREIKKNMPEGHQLDMTLAPAMAVKFKLRNQKGYFSLENWTIDGNEFIKNKKAIKKRLGDLLIRSNLIVLDDTGNIDKLDENIDEKKIYKKAIKQTKYYGVDDGLFFERLYIPVKNKSYPVYIHHIFRSEKEELKDLESDLPIAQFVSPIFPIISIQNVEGCYLSKDKDAKLIFIKKEEKTISEYLSNQITKKEKNIKVCQLDLENLSSLTFLNKLNYKLDSITFFNLKNIDDWSVLLKIKNVKTILFSKCSLDITKKINADIIKKINKRNINIVIEGLVINLNVKLIEIPFEGGTYSGEINSDGMPEGYGQLSHEDGTLYTGTFKGKFHGFGSYVLPSGSVYIGEWKNGNQEGSATFVSKDGFRYVGKFKNNKYHGKGEFYIMQTGEKTIVEHNEGEEIKKK